MTYIKPLNTLRRKEIVDFLGTTIETVSRKANQLQSEGIIAIVGRKEVIIHDRNKLEELVNI